MLLAIDIGNSSAKFGVYDRADLSKRFTVSMELGSDHESLKNLIKTSVIEPIDAIAVSSVVPESTQILSILTEEIFGVKPVLIDSTFDLGIEVMYCPPNAVGTDRIIAASAAVRYGTPVIVCDIGTATTIDAVDKNGRYLGGTIIPGPRTMAGSLKKGTSQLPEIDIRRTDSVIGNSTETSIRSGIFWGSVGVVEGIVRRMKNELGGSPKVVATGGWAETIAAETDCIDIVENDLVLRGIAETAYRNDQN
jgi:type III pantothenate kinase